ncbi:MAG: SAM hydroxide adenosyltransferase, partial [Fimbriimonadales bacterium]
PDSPARASTPSSTNIPARASTPSSTNIPARATNPSSTDIPARATTPSSTDIPARAVAPDACTEESIGATGVELGVDTIVSATIVSEGTDRNVRATVRLPLVRTFGEVAWGEPLAYWGSNGYLEVAVNGGSAAEQLQISESSVLELQIEANAF